jgi:cell wall-associated NlpC family hydrolase
MKRYRPLVLCLLACSATWAAPVSPARQAVVIAPVVDVWNAPTDDSSTLTNDNRETQLLFGEKVLIHESSGSWVRIEAVLQPEYSHNNKWEGYPGWIENRFLWQPSRANNFRDALLDAARQMIATEYEWGGMSAGRGIDCSGLVHLAYRVNGLKIPRDSHEQWMKATKIKRVDLLPGDLIFSAKADHPEKITHVAMYAGKGRIIEAPQTGLQVRDIAFEAKFGKPLNTVESGQTVGERVIYFGRYL